MTKKVREAIHQIINMNWRVMGLDKMCQALQSTVTPAIADRSEGFPSVFSRFFQFFLILPFVGFFIFLLFLPTFFIF